MVDPKDDLQDFEDDDFPVETESAGISLDPDTILDQFIPRSIDWKKTVRKYPVASVIGVGLIGLVVGRSKGSAIIAGASAGLSAALTRQLSDVFEGDFFDF